MKNYQTIKKVFFALLFTIALFSFQSSYAQYARLERQDHVGYRVSTSDPAYPIHDYNGADYYLRIYSNAACTIPTTPAADVHIVINYTTYLDEALNWGGDTIIEETCGTGQTEISLGHIVQWDLYYDIYNSPWGIQNTYIGNTVTGTGITYLGVVDVY